MNFVSWGQSSKIPIQRFLVRLVFNKRYLLPRLIFTLFFILALYKLAIANIQEKESWHGSNEPEKACKFPKLLLDDPLIRKHFIEEKRLECAEEKNWVYTDNGKFYIDNLALRNHGEVICDVYRIKRIDDDHYSERKYLNVKNDTPLVGDMLRVACRGDDGATYENLHAAVPIPLEEPGRTSREYEGWNKSQTGHNVNIMMYLLDSVSRMHFMRKLPKFYRFLTEEFKGYILEGYNIVGDSTAAALVPMLTGHFQQELPEARKRHENASKLDDWPLIFKNYTSRGYVTSFVEEQAWTSALHMRLKGFHTPPFDHYLRPLLIAWEGRKRRHKPYCFGDTPESIVWLEFFRQLQVVHRPRNEPHFSILFTSETSHDFYNKVQALDDHLTERFRQLMKDGYFDDTFVFVMSDHGHRHVITRVTQTGKWEERLPFLFIRPPPRLCDRYKYICDNLRDNRNSLVTVFDIHATLRQILNFPPSDVQAHDARERGISLFKRVPAERTCADAAISAHFCSCLEWKEAADPSNDEFVKGALQYFVDKINEKTTTEIPGACANLTVGDVISARHLMPNDKLLAFKESLDYDNFFPDLSDNSTIAAIIYQVHFTTQPGPGEWEISVTYFTELRRYAMSMDSVSRLNKYGAQARCVEGDYPHLRMFCFCLRDTV